MSQMIGDNKDAILGGLPGDEPSVQVTSTKIGNDRGLNITTETNQYKLERTFLMGKDGLKS